MVAQIKIAAESVGINAFVSNSNEKIETQLNRLTKEEDLPIMLIAWDIDVSLSFDPNGFLENPSQSIIALLVSKPEDLTKDAAEEKSKEMGVLFLAFIQKLYTTLAPLMKNATIPITNASMKYVPKHGAGKHSGVVAKWTQRDVHTITC